MMNGLNQKTDRNSKFFFLLQLLISGEMFCRGNTLMKIKWHVCSILLEQYYMKKLMNIEYLTGWKTKGEFTAASFCGSGFFLLVHASTILKSSHWSQRTKEAPAERRVIIETVEKLKILRAILQKNSSLIVIRRQLTDLIFFFFFSTNFHRNKNSKILKIISYLVAYQSHSTIVGPWKIGDWCTSIVNQFYTPSPFVFYPYENDSGTVAGGKFLIGLVPLDQNHLKHKENVKTANRE